MSDIYTRNHIRFEQQPNLQGRITSIFDVINKSNGESIGTIKCVTAQRQYVFISSHDSSYNSD